MSTVNQHNFVLPGVMSVTPEALTGAREFAAAIRRLNGKDWVVAFSWAPSLTVRRSADGPEQEVGPCLMLGAYERAQIPDGFIQNADFEYVIDIPEDIVRSAGRRTIDRDETKLFKLAVT
jgi:hypothetical protein